MSYSDVVRLFILFFRHFSFRCFLIRYFSLSIFFLVFFYIFTFDIFPFFLFPSYRIVHDFYQKDSISWQAPGKRDYLTVRENGIRVQHQKRFLLYNIREIHELFIQEHQGMSEFFPLKKSDKDKNIELNFVLIS